MNESNRNASLNEETTPVELRGVESALGRLAERDRAGAPAGFEDRLFESTRASLGESSGVIARIGGAGAGVTGWRFRLAAAVAIAAVGVFAAVWVRPFGAAPKGQGEVALGNVGTSDSYTAEELAAQIRADITAWASDTAGLSPAENEIASLHAQLKEIETGAYSADPWDDVDLSNWEPSL